MFQIPGHLEVVVGCFWRTGSGERAAQDPLSHCRLHWPYDTSGECPWLHGPIGPPLLSLEDLFRLQVSFTDFDELRQQSLM